MPKLTDKPHTLYITHGGRSTLRLLTRRIRPDDHHWVFTYTAGAYHLDKMTTVDLFDDNGEKILDVSQFRFETCTALIEFIKNYAEDIHSVALDANLTEVGGSSFSQNAHDIIALTACKEALLFTETESCLKETESYLNYQHTLHKPPLTLERALVSERARLNQILFMEIQHPKEQVHEREELADNVAAKPKLKPEHQGRNSFWSFSRRSSKRPKTVGLCCSFWKWSKVASDVDEPTKTPESTLSSHLHLHLKAERLPPRNGDAVMSIQSDFSTLKS